MSLLVSAKDLCVSYPAPGTGLKSLFGGKRDMPNALDSISFELERGRSLALVGLNGSGKSTLLRTIAGIYEPDSGELHVEGDIASLFNLGIGMRMDTSGRNNIILMGMVRGHSRKTMLELTPSIIEFSGLKDVIDDPIVSYSQGMAMRLSFAVATSLKPDILLLDEWIGAGDRVFRQKAQKRLEAMVGEARGLVLASHNVHIVRQYCSSALWLDAGKVVMQGGVDEVVDALQNGVATIHAAGGSAGTHCDAPLWLRHLIPDAFDREGHLISHRAGDDHHV